MNVFKTIFIIQSKRLFIKRNIAILLVVGLILFLGIQRDKIKYKHVIENKKVFQNMEAEKVGQYILYDQYAGYGIKILFIPSPFSILHNDSMFNEITSNINIGERLNISMSLNNGFSIKKYGFKDFSEIILIFSIICGLICGFEITKDKDYFKVLSRVKNIRNIFLKSVISNIILLNFAFLLLIGICMLWLLITGINLFNIILLISFFVVILVISFFHAIGTLVGSLNIRKSTKVTVLTILIAFFILFIPWLTFTIDQTICGDIESITNLEYRNFKIIMGAEKRAFNKIGTFKVNGKEAPENVKKIVNSDLEKVFKNRIDKSEINRRDYVISKIKVNHTLLSFFPVTFLISVNKEIGNYGGRNYIDLYSYSRRIKKDFRNFIIKKKIYGKAKKGKIEPFISKDDDKNVFYGKSHLPFNFWLGVFLTPFYAVLLLFFSFKTIKKRNKIPDPKTAYTIEKEKDNPLFVLCENASIKEDIFNFYQCQKASVCLEKINIDDFILNGIKAHEIFKLLSVVRGVDEQKALENMGIMGIKDLSDLPVCHEIILKIYAAVSTAADSDVIVSNDFLLNASRELEKSILNLLLFLEKSGKKIIYLSTQMYQEKNNLGEIVSKKFKGEKFFNVRINLNKVSFR